MKLRQIGSRLAPAPPRLPTLAHDAARDRVHHWRAWYRTQRWRRLRWQVLTDALFTCARCRRVEKDTSLLVADHVVPHRGDEHLFWFRGNLQCLCKPCHDGAKQREERGGGVEYPHPPTPGTGGVTI